MVVEIVRGVTSSQYPSLMPTLYPGRLMTVLQPFVSFRSGFRTVVTYIFLICVCTSRFLRRYSVILRLGVRLLCCILTAAGAALP